MRIKSHSAEKNQIISTIKRNPLISITSFETIFKIITQSYFSIHSSVFPTLFSCIKFKIWEKVEYFSRIFIFANSFFFFFCLRRLIHSILHPRCRKFSNIAFRMYFFHRFIFFIIFFRRYVTCVTLEAHILCSAKRKRLCCEIHSTHI